MFCFVIQLKSYEQDWKMEREEKDKVKADKERIKKEAQEVNQTYEKLRMEHFSLRQNFQKIFSQHQVSFLPSILLYHNPTNQGRS